MKNKRLFASIMAAAMMLSSLPMTAIGMVSAEDTTVEAPAADEYVLNIDFSTDASSSFTHGARTVSYDDGTNNNGDPFLHVSAITTGNGYAVDTNLIFTPGETITLEAGEYAFSIDMRHGYDAAYTITGNTTDAAVKKDAEAEDMEMTYASAAKNFRNIWIKPTFSNAAAVVLAEGSGKRTAGTFAFDDTTVHGLYGGSGSEYPDLFMVGGEWRTATANFTVTEEVSLNSLTINLGNDGVDYTNVDSIDVDNVTIVRTGDYVEEEPEVWEPLAADTIAGSVKDIADVSGAFEAGNTYLRVSNVTTSETAFNINAVVGENLPETLELWLDVSTDLLLLKDSETMLDDYSRSISLQAYNWNKKAGVAIADVTRDAWTSVKISDYNATTFTNRNYDLMIRSNSVDMPDFIIDNVRLVDTATGDTVAIQDFENAEIVDGKITCDFGTYGTVSIHKGASTHSIVTDENYVVATINGEEQNYNVNEALSAGVYTVTAKIRNDAMVLPTKRVDLNFSDHPSSLVTLETMLANNNDAGNKYYRYFYFPSGINPAFDNNTVDVTATVILANGAAVTPAEITVGVEWTEISFEFTSTEATTLESIAFAAEPTIRETTVLYPATVAYVGIKDVEVEKIVELPIFGDFSFVDTAVAGDDIANKEAGNKYIRVGGIADGVDARNAGLNIAFDGVTEAASGLKLELDIAVDTVVKKTEATAQDSYDFATAVRVNTNSVAVSRTSWTAVQFDFGSTGNYIQRADSPYGLFDYVIDNVRLVDASGNVVATETFDSTNFSVDGKNITVTFPGYGTVNFNGTVSAGNVSLVTAENYFTAVATDTAGNEILSNTANVTLEPGTYEFTALVKNNEVVQSTTVVGTSATDTGKNATTAWRDNDGNNAVEYSKNDNTLAKEWIAAYIEAEGGDDFYRYISQTTEWRVNKDNNQILVTPIVKLSSGDVTGTAVTANNDAWTEVSVTFTITEDTTIANIGFEAKHILSGKTLLEYPQADYANLAFKNVEIVPFVCEHTNTTTTTTDASCSTDGKTVVTCTDCGKPVSETTIPATGEHDCNAVNANNAEYHILDCKNCDYEGQEAHTNGDDYICDECGYDSTPAAEPTYVAQIGDAKYETLAAAIEAATTGATITLLADAEAVTVAKAVTINKGEFTVEVTVDGTTYGKADTADAIVVYPMIGSLAMRSLSLEDIIQINYRPIAQNFTEYGFTDADIMANGRVLIWTGDAISDDATYLLGTESQNKAFEGSATQSGYKVYLTTSDGIAAKEMGDIQKYRFCITDANGVVHYSEVKEYSPMEYCKSQYASASGSYKELLIAIANFGASAQLNFNYKTDSLMNTFLAEDEQNVYDGYVAEALDDDAAGKYKFTVTEVLKEGVAKSLAMEGAIEINLQLYLQDAYKNADSYTLLYWSEDTYNSVTELTEENADQVATFDKSYTRPYAKINGIPAKKLGDTAYFCAKVEINGEVYYSALQVYSAHQYAVNTIAKTTNATYTEALKNMCKSMVIYSNAAAAYFGN